MDPCTVTLYTLAQFLARQPLVDSFAHLFMEVYKDSWGEDWTRAEVVKLLHPRAGYQSSWVNLMLHQETICGFAYASVVRPSSICEIPKHFSGGKEGKIALVRATQQAIRTHRGTSANSPILHFKEFAIARPYRTEVPRKLRSLIYPILRQAADRGIEDGVIRTSKKSPMYTLAQNLLACQEIFLYPDDENVLMMGAIAAACTRLDRLL